MINIRKLEAELWESADLLRADSKLTSNQYCMPVLGLIFLRYAYSRFKMVEAEILKNRPVRGGRILPVEASDFASKSALFLPKEAQYEYLVNLPADIASARLTNQNGHTMNSLGEVVNNAMELVEEQRLGGSMPSSASAACMAVAVVLSLLFAKANPWVFLLPISVGFSQIYVGKNYPFDILVGWLLGLVSVIAVWWACHLIIIRFSSHRKLG